MAMGPGIDILISSLSTIIGKWWQSGSGRMLLRFCGSAEGI
jgi:hypothetical protein